MDCALGCQQQVGRIALRDQTQAAALLSVLLLPSPACRARQEPRRVTYIEKNRQEPSTDLAVLRWIQRHESIRLTGNKLVENNFCISRNARYCFSLLSAFWQDHSSVEWKYCQILTANCSG